MKKKALLTVLLGLLLVGTLPFQALASASKAEALAKTAAPPIEITPMTAFDPTFKHLDSGSAVLSIINSGGTVGLSGSSSANKYVSTIGIKLILQRWTGTAWEDYNIGSEVTKTNDSYIASAKQLTVPTGYYYRIRSIHWVIQDGVREQGERTTSSLLVN